MNNKGELNSKESKQHFEAFMSFMKDLDNQPKMENFDLKVRFKRLNKEAVLPAYAKPGDAGVDLTAVSKIETKETVIYGTGIAVEIPEGHLGLLMPRSSVVKKDAMLKNSVGLIDSGYRGELGFVFHKTQDERASINIYNIGDRIGQLVILPFPKIEYVEVPELSETERGTGGYGSTGK